MKKPNFTKKFIFSAIFTVFTLTSGPASAWNGYDYDDKTAIEIGPGNYVEEGRVIQFYDAKTDNYHTAKVSFIETIPGGTRLQLKDLDDKKERTFIMQD